MHQLGFHPSNQPASLNDPCPLAALGAPYLDINNAYANLPLQPWFAVSDPVGAMIYYSPNLSQPLVWPTTATMTTNPSSALALASQLIKIKMDREVAFKSSALYAKLIYNALLSIPRHKLPLHGIYLWFMENTSIARDDTSKGWKSSIRYNLLRNLSTLGKRPRLIWALTSEALANSIKPTK
ncbi:hypothetical protein BJY00DRAFT_302820 [Aspergillus carlsbadensis]|nr:hypothetical protein BJY00DRAFT_302820 [Aspergillus carlsbadensis]